MPGAGCGPYLSHGGALSLRSARGALSEGHGGGGGRRGGRRLRPPPSANTRGAAPHRLKVTAQRAAQRSSIPAPPPPRAVLCAAPPECAPPGGARPSGTRLCPLPPHPPAVPGSRSGLRCRTPRHRPVPSPPPPISSGTLPGMTPRRGWHGCRAAPRSWRGGVGVPLVPRPTARDPPTTAAPTSSSAPSARQSPPRPPLRAPGGAQRGPRSRPPPRPEPPHPHPTLPPLPPHDSPCCPTGSAAPPDPTALPRTTPPSPAPSAALRLRLHRGPPSKPTPPGRDAGAVPSPQQERPRWGDATHPRALCTPQDTTAGQCGLWGSAGCGAAPYRDAQEEIHGGTVAGRGHSVVPTADPSPVTCHHSSATVWGRHRARHEGLIINHTTAARHGQHRRVPRPHGSARPHGAAPQLCTGAGAVTWMATPGCVGGLCSAMCWAVPR